MSKNKRDRGQRGYQDDDSFRKKSRRDHMSEECFKELRNETRYEDERYYTHDMGAE